MNPPHAGTGPGAALYGIVSERSVRFHWSDTASVPAPGVQCQRFPHEDMPQFRGPDARQAARGGPARRRASETVRVWGTWSLARPIFGCHRAADAWVLRGDLTPPRMRSVGAGPPPGTLPRAGPSAVLMARAGARPRGGHRDGSLVEQGASRFLGQVFPESPLSLPLPAMLSIAVPTALR
jgi:hypothetical protein